MQNAPNPDVAALLQQAGTAIAQGRLPAAEAHYRAALALAPDEPMIGVALGHVLRRMQRLPDARARFEAALRHNPDLAEAHHGLGLAQQDMGNLAGAEAAYRAALDRKPGFLPAALALATLLNATGRADDALALLAGATAAEPMLEAGIEQARGTARLLKDENEAALPHFERALAVMPTHPEAAHSRAIALQRLGREDEALAGLRRAVKDNPANLLAHQRLNELLYRQKRDDEFLRSFDEAAAKYPGTPHFALAKAAMLVRAERPAEALALYMDATKLAPGNPMILQGQAMAQLKLGQVDAAIASYEEGLRRLPGDRNMLTGLGAAYLMARTPKKAEAAAIEALQRAPTDQTGLCLLGTAWRLMNDEREHALNRYDDFIQVFDLEPPPGFSGMAEFCAELDRWLDSQHRDEREHLDQSLRGGTQTVSDLFRTGRHALVDGLRQRIEEAVGRYTARLPRDERHPFLRHGRNFRFAGSWSSRLADNGYHTNHIHPAGWISSAFYVALPDVVTQAGARQGWIKFGEPSYEVGLSDPVRRAIEPRVGRLVLFPSYMWHGTVPFHAPQSRTTVAFDAVPG